jgi:hypothetical protein
MPNGVIMTDLALGVAYTNPAARRTLELLTGELRRGRSPFSATCRFPTIVRPVVEDGLAAVTAEITTTDPFRLYELTARPRGRGRRRRAAVRAESSW